MRDTFEEKAAFWRERLQACLEKKAWSATVFIDEYNKHLNEEKWINRNTFYRWRHVGQQSRPGKIIGFPKYENMLRVAQLLEVDVGYLTGETDEEKFTLEKVRDVLNLDAEAIKVIMKLTGAMGWGDTKKEAEITERYFKCSDKIKYYYKEIFKEMFAFLIRSEKFLDIMTGLVELREMQNNKNHLKENKEMGNAVNAWFNDIVKSILDGVEIDGIENPEEYFLEQFGADPFREDQGRKKKIIKFNLTESLILLLNEIFPDND